MSHKKNIDESHRWFRTGYDDLDTAEILQNNKKYAHSCFHAQQAVEKAMKSVWYFFDHDPWGHSIYKLIIDFKDIDENAFKILNAFIDDAKKLDRFYIPTRYPNGLPDITPDMAFSRDDSEYGIKVAKSICMAIENIIKYSSNYSIVSG